MAALRGMPAIASRRTILDTSGVDADAAAYRDPRAPRTTAARRRRLYAYGDAPGRADHGSPTSTRSTPTSAGRSPAATTRSSSVPEPTERIAMARIHGKKGDVMLDPTGGRDRRRRSRRAIRSSSTPRKTSSTSRVSRTPTGRSSWGSRSYDGTMTGFWDSATTPEQLFAVIFSDVPAMIHLIPNTVEPTFLFKGLGYLDGSISVSAKGAVSWSSKFAAVGQLGRWSRRSPEPCSTAQPDPRPRGADPLGVLRRRRRRRLHAAAASAAARARREAEMVRLTARIVGVGQVQDGATPAALRDGRQAAPLVVSD